MTTKIKGAIEVLIFECENGNIEVETPLSDDTPNGLAFKHADLEAYVQERIEENPFIVFMQALYTEARILIGVDPEPDSDAGKRLKFLVDVITEYEKCFEDFKKENHE